jgi:transcriptional regulator with GAF, ATPase, and Fis domain
LIIRGEPGVGKDVLARLIHAASPRQSCAFIKVNCAVQARAGRCEVDLFGTERGSSPLASRRLLGSFELANHGTIYLDDIGALPPALVPRLVRALCTGQVTRTGGSEIMQIDARLIASDAGLRKNSDDDDLWRELHRLNAVEILVPPLRERAEEVPEFASLFLERFNRRYQRDVQLCPETMAAWRTHKWPRNIRELEEAVHGLVVERSSRLPLR